MKTNYRGFDITLSASDRWMAEISNPDTGRSWSQRLTSPITEGSSACLKRAQNLIDAFVALHGPRSN